MKQSITSGQSLRRLILGLILVAAMVPDGMKAQEKKGFFLWNYIDKLVNDTINDGRGKFLVYPTVAYAPETSWEFGLSTLYLFYAKKDTTNRLSELNGWSFITLEKQYGIWLDHAIYSHKNRWFFLGRARFQRFPLLYHGVGPNTPEHPTALVDANYLLLKERFLRQIKGNLFAGIEFDYQNLFNADFVWEPDVVNPVNPRGFEGSQNLEIGLGLIYDDRHNVLNVRRGNFAELAYLQSSKAWGSDFSFSTIVAEGRIFRPTWKNQVFAAHVLGLFSYGDVPFNQLALMGGESMLRGYYLGRYRDRHHVAGQVEYRFLPFVDKKFWRRFGGAVFMGTGSVFSQSDPLSLDKFQLAGGAGLRFLIFPEKDVYTRLDVAFTKEGPGFYLFIGEAF